MLAKLESAFGKAANLEKVEYIAGGSKSSNYVNPAVAGKRETNFEHYSLRKDSEDGSWNLIRSSGSTQMGEAREELIGRFPKLEYGVMMLDNMATALKFMPANESDGLDTHVSLRQAKLALELRNS
jgi:hypothetical protein